MALLTQPVIADLGSNEVELMRQNLNRALVFIDAFKTALAAAADLAALKTAVAALVTSDMVLVVPTRNVPASAQPQFPTHG